MYKRIQVVELNERFVVSVAIDGFLNASHSPKEESNKEKDREC